MTNHKEAQKNRIMLYAELIVLVFSIICGIAYIVTTINLN